MKSTIAIGDVHGNLPALDDLLDRLEPMLSQDDTVVFLGDYIDRGPDSRGCIERILQFRSSTPARVVTLLGNHEDWLLRTIHDPRRHSWILGMEALPTIASYSQRAAGSLTRAIDELGPRMVLQRESLPYRLFLDEIPDDHLSFLTQLTHFHRDERGVFVHGGLDPQGGSVEYQSPNTILWGGDGFPETYQGPDLVVYGHHDDAVLDEQGWPMPCVSTSAIGLDTISHGVLSAIRLPERLIIQSDRHRI